MSEPQKQQLCASPRPLSLHDHPLPSSQPESKQKMGDEVVQRLENLSMHNDDENEQGKQESERDLEAQGVKAHQYEEDENKEAGEVEEEESVRDKRIQQEQESFARDYFDGHLKEAIGEPKSMQVVELVSVRSSQASFRPASGDLTFTFST